MEFEYLHRKSRCEKAVGGADVGNDVNTLGACFHMFFNVCLHSRSFPFPIGGNLAALSTGSQSGIGGGMKIPET